MAGGVAQQFIGARGSRPLDTNAVSKTFKDNATTGSNPVDEQIRISFGTIAEVDDETNRVKVDVVGRGGEKQRVGSGHDGTKEGIWVPIIQPLEIIHSLYGALRKGLLVRVFWRGKDTPGIEAVAEVFSNVTMEEFRAGSQEARSNELATSPHNIFTGGVNF